ncbi:MAG: DinB family protein, partial [Anaerolineales bacterium]
MLNFDPVRNNEITLNDLAAGLNRGDLIDLTNEMIDAQLNLISECSDRDVVFVPEDPLADDPFAEDPEDVTLAWNLGHVIVHVTASSEEAAAIAAELARGVKYHGRSRYE